MHLFKRPGTSSSTGGIDAVGSNNELLMPNGVQGCCRNVASAVGGWLHHPLKKSGSGRRSISGLYEQALSSRCVLLSRLHKNVNGFMVVKDDGVR